MPTPRLGYFQKNGTKVPGVTTVLGRFKDSGPLLFWAFNQGRSGAARLYDASEKAADIGTLAHSMFLDHRLRGLAPELVLVGQPESLAVPARKAYATAVQWQESLRAELVPCETPMVSEVYGFGGTPDFLMRERWRDVSLLSMADLKTSNGIYREMLCQVAAYGILWDENHPDDPITGGYHIARFAKESSDFEHRFFSEVEDAKQLFLLLLEAYKLDEKLKKRVR